MLKSTKILIGFLFLSVYGFAQTGGVRSTSQSVRIIIEETVDISIASDNSEDFIFTNKEDYDNGITQNAASTFSVNSNVPWKVYVSASQETFIGPEGSTMPADIFSIATAGSDFQTLGFQNTENALITGEKGSAQANGNTFSVDYKANPGFDYDQGTYQLDLIYTISPE